LPRYLYRFLSYSKQTDTMHHSTIKKSPKTLSSYLRCLIILCSGLSLACTATAQNPLEADEKTTERPYFNDKKAPNAEDLIAIQKLLQKNVEQARKATICIQLDQGGSGSGVIISEDGLVLTAAHVSTGVDKKLTVVMEDGTEHEAISLGLHSETDAAMVQITDKKKFPFVKLDMGKKRESASTKLGDWVFSLGHSGGFDKARGSGLRLGRLVKRSDTTIQSDCTLIGGDSGGPLFDINGYLVGIHSRVGQVSEQNMHVPIHVFHEHWDTMKKGEFIGQGPFAQKPVKGKGFLGVAVEQVATGLKVTDIDPDASAAKAEIEIGDILTKANETDLKEKANLADFLQEQFVGTDITFTVIKKGTDKPIEVKVNLGKR